MSERKEISYNQEILRKSIHLISLCIPVIYTQVSKEQGLWMLVPVTLLFVVPDVLQNFYLPLRALIHRFFGDMLREHEQQSQRFILNGASYVLLSACVTIVLFPKVIAITAFSVLIISDISAALIGRKFGKHKFLDKSLEGTLSFIVTAIIVVLIVHSTFSLETSFIVFGFLSSIVSGLVENISSRIKMDDNFSIPITFSLCMVILQFVFQ